MFNQSTRDETPNWRTPGPGTYNLDVSSFPDSPADYAAPFLTSSKRFSKCTDTHIPAPNMYKIKSDLGNTRGVSFWLSTTKRFPGPKREKSKTKFDSFRLGSAIVQKPRANLRSIRKSLKFSERLPCTAPSIPDRLSKNGYEFNPDGSTFKVPTDFCDSTLGPAFYNVPREDLCFTTLLYKGNFWSHRTDSRLSACEISPGPGDYNIECAPKQELLHFPVNVLNIPRFLDKVVQKELSENTPGPAGYFIPSTFQIPIMDLCCTKAAFLTSAKRFHENDSHFGPNLAPPKSSFASGKFQNSSLAPFGTGAKRFKTAVVGQTPEPNRYSIKGFAEKAVTNIARAKVNTKIAPFGSNTPRMKSPVTFSSIRLQPQPEKKIVLDLTTKTMSTKSLTPREPTRRRIPSRIVHPAPGDHEVTRVMLYLRQRTSHRRPSKRKPDPAAFLVSSKRFPEAEQTADAKLSRFRCKNIRRYPPGPGTYNLSEPKPCVSKGTGFPKQERFPISAVPLRWPSPATYQLSPKCMHTMIKHTYNAKLGSLLPRNYGAKWRPVHFKSTYTSKP